MTYENAMLSVITTFIIAVLIWDAFAYYCGGYKATISGVIWNAQRKVWWIKYLAAIIFAFMWWHWFW